jgi:hypothetical protein
VAIYRVSTECKKQTVIHEVLLPLQRNIARELYEMETCGFLQRVLQLSEFNYNYNTSICAPLVALRTSRRYSSSIHTRCSINFFQCNPCTKCGNIWNRGCVDTILDVPPKEKIQGRDIRGVRWPGDWSTTANPSPREMSIQKVPNL